ncbi:MAG: tetratricopeptide repeat protein [Planctomycetaceae bacterium]
MRHRTKRPSCRAAALPAAVLLALLPGVAWSQAPDRVRLTDKTEIIGEIVGLSPGDVEIKDQRGDEPRKVPIDRIRDVLIGGEPEQVRTARSLLGRQDPAGALDELGKIEQGELDGASNNVLAEYAFVKAAATARKATATGVDLAGGEKALREFVQKNPRSHHFFPASEMLGDLLLRAGKFDDATAAYAALEKGPPAFRVRATAAKANSLYVQKKYAEAEKAYEAAAKIDTDPKDEPSARQKREAQAGRARCLSRQGKPADAITAVQEVIRGADPEDRELLARAYAVLGDACRAANKEQDAIIAFLTVDLVYNTLPESHAEALFNLVQLWQKADNPERSREAKQSLETSYPDSRWTKALGAAAGKG